MVDISFRASVESKPWKDIVLNAEAGPCASLSYNFPEKLAEIPVTQIVEVYRWVLAATPLDQTQIDLMLPMWLHGHLYQKRDISDAAFAPLLYKTGFHWPLLDTWAQKATSLGVWPEPWEGRVPHPNKYGRVAIDYSVLKLLSLFISSKVNHKRDADKLRPNSLLHRWGWRLQSQEPQSAQLIEGMAEQVVLEDWRTYPPFFPGDLTYITLNRPPSANPTASE